MGEVGAKEIEAAACVLGVLVEDFGFFGALEGEDEVLDGVVFDVEGGGFNDVHVGELWFMKAGIWRRVEDLGGDILLHHANFVRDDDAPLGVLFVECGGGVVEGGGVLDEVGFFVEVTLEPALAVLAVLKKFDGEGF